MSKDNSNNNFSSAVVILAAGLSSRMGIPKPFLKYDGNKLFIDKIIEEYLEFGCDKIIITISKNDSWVSFMDKYLFTEKINFIENHHLEYERFYSVKLGLSDVVGTDFCFIQNIDNPFVNQEILSEIFHHKSKDGYVVPTYRNKGGHPVLLGKKVILSIENEQDDSNLKSILQKFKRYECNIDDEKILININSEQDYFKYFKKN